MARSARVTAPTLFLMIALPAALAVAAYFGAGVVTDQHRRPEATVQARARFVGVRAAVTKRLAQPHPIEFGAVWATHSGRICGLVNGEGSFSGLTGMTPFYADGAAVKFALDSNPDDFEGGWLACGQDIWVVILPGSTEEGICGTKAHAARCRQTGRSHFGA